MGVGDSWGTREEFLHPRDSHGRFRKSWKMADDVISRISDFLGKFNPRTFGSDGQAGQYAFNLSQKSPTKFAGGTDLHRLRTDFEHTNHALRLGQTDPSTEKFVKMMEREKLPAPDDIILSRVMTPEAFGLHADTGDQIQELTGKLIADRGYGAARLGTPLNESIPGQPRVLMTIATPKGTPIMVPGESRDDRRIFLDKGQNLRITKVKPDGQGGYFVLAVAEPGNKATPEPMRKLEPSGVTPQQREARIAGAQEITRKRMQQYRSPAPQEPAPIPAATPAAPSPTPASQAPTAAAPRTETPVSQSIGQGPSAPVPSAPKPEPAPATTEGTIELSPELRGQIGRATIPGLREAAKSYGIKVPSSKRTKSQIIEHILGELVKQEAVKRGIATPETPSSAAPADVSKMTIPQLRAHAKEQGIRIPSSVTRKADIVSHIQGGGAKPSASKPGATATRVTTDEAGKVLKVQKISEKATPSDVTKMTIPQLRAHAKERGVGIPSSITRKADIVAYIQGNGRSAPKSTATTSAREALDKLHALGEYEPGSKVGTRADGRAIVDELNRAQLVAAAKELSIPGAQRMTVADLRYEIVEATIGRRRDSIATRGFVGISPNAPGKSAAEALAPE